MYGIAIRRLSTKNHNIIGVKFTIRPLTRTYVPPELWQINRMLAQLEDSHVSPSCTSVLLQGNHPAMNEIHGRVIPFPLNF